MNYVISADWHLGYQPNQSPARSRDFYTAARHIVHEVCNHQEYAGLLLLGDVRDKPLIYPEHFQTLLEFIGLTQRANKTMGLLMGNHDQTNPSWVQVIAQNFRGVGDLSTPQGIRKVGLNPAAVRGIHYTHRPQLTETLQQTPSSCSVLLLHQSFEETINNAPFWDLNAQTLRTLLPLNPSLTVFSGDIHNPSNTPNAHLNTRILSPGSLQITDINEQSFGTSEKYYIVAEGDSLLNPRHVALPGTVTRPWHYIQLTDESQIDGLTNTLRTLAATWAETKRPPGIVRIRTLPDLYFATQLALENIGELKQQFLECRLQVKTLSAARAKSQIEQTPDLTHQLGQDRHAWLRTQIEQLALADPKLSPKAQALIQALCRSQNQNKKEIRETIQRWKNSYADTKLAS
jgi:DNA repair exonuclease SbcCD nuclease subunit